MKKIALIILSLMLMLTFVGCGTGGTVELDLVTPYYEYAQKCIDEGKTDEAIKVLEEGIEKTKSEKLQKLLEEITKKTEEDKDTASSEKPASSDKAESTEKPSSESQTSSKTEESKKPQRTTEEVISLWCHGWVDENATQEGGSFIIYCDLDPINEEIAFTLELTSSLPAQRIAEVWATVKLSTMQDDCAEFSFTEDGWGTSGKVKITHNGDTLTVEVYDTVSGGGNWGFTNSTYKMLDIDDTIWGM